MFNVCERPDRKKSIEMHGQVAVSAQLHRPKCSCTNDKEVSQSLSIQRIFDSNTSLYNHLLVQHWQNRREFWQSTTPEMERLYFHYKVLFIYFCICWLH